MNEQNERSLSRAQKTGTDNGYSYPSPYSGNKCESKGSLGSHPPVSGGGVNYYDYDEPPPSQNRKKPSRDNIVAAVQDENDALYIPQTWGMDWRTLVKAVKIFGFSYVRSKIRYVAKLPSWRLAEMNQDKPESERRSRYLLGCFRNEAPSVGWHWDDYRRIS